MISNQDVETGGAIDIPGLKRHDSTTAFEGRAPLLAYTGNRRSPEQLYKPSNMPA